MKKEIVNFCKYIITGLGIGVVCAVALSDLTAVPIGICTGAIFGLVTEYLNKKHE